ncbi:hypothetical protein RB594_001614 [Gaeumannomyces avenae]
MSSQLSFSLRVSSGVKSVHLLGSWDNYQNQLPLSKDKTASKSGSWKGTFRFPVNTLEAGQRYWYYYIIDGYHCAHNPAEASTVEPTTGRSLNILDVAKSSSKSSSSSSSSKSSSRHSSSSSKSSKSSSSSSSKRSSSDIAKGRPLSISQIKSPKPVAPHATRHILDGSYDDQEVDELAQRFGSASFDEYEDVITDFGSASPVSSLGSGSDLSYRSDSSSPNSSMSGYSTPASDCSSCTCERYGITRKGDRVRLDCGGSRCGYDNESDCSSSEDEYVSRSSRRNGMVVRA